MPNGPLLFLLSALGLAGGSALALAGAPTETEALRLIIRGTARSSLILFLLAFIAGPWHSLWPSRASSALLSLRRWSGLSFALSHGVHAVALVTLATHDPALFWSLTNPVNVVTGGIAYGFIVLMAATSFDAARRWTVWPGLHRIGLWYLWISFVVAFGKRVPANPTYSIALVLLLLALGLRMAAYRRKRASALAFR